VTQIIAGEHLDRASRWVYQGLWGVLVKWFRVPDRPPELPCLPGDELQAFRPSTGFIRYLKLQFWLTLALICGVALFGWFGVLVASAKAALAVALPLLLLIALPALACYLALHLRYDTTWYVMTGRSLRIRRGIWIIHETTITFENVQNVEVDQGPLQRFFGIADIRVDTAGGGQPQPGKQGAAMASGHRGLIEGVHDAPRIRDLILDRLRRSPSAGLGDERHLVPASSPGWSPAQLAMLREIRDAAQGLVAP
jgi:membrane protein YdbS with pleckstrin-like domain